MDAFWSVMSMPIGLFLCFTPVVVAWVLTSIKGANPEKKNRP
jgi:hypothetical protein